MSQNTRFVCYFWGSKYSSVLFYALFPSLAIMMVSIMVVIMEMMISQVQAVSAEPCGMLGTGTKIFPKVGSDSYVAE